MTSVRGADVDTQIRRLLVPPTPPPPRRSALIVRLSLALVLTAALLMPVSSGPAREGSQWRRRVARKHYILVVGSREHSVLSP